MQVRIHLGPMTNLSILFTFAGSNTASGLKSMADFNLGWFIRLLYLFLFEVPTVVLRTNGTSAVYRSKMAFFKRAWQKVKVLSRP